MTSLAHQTTPDRRDEMDTVEFATGTSTYRLAHDKGTFTLTKLSLGDGQHSRVAVGRTFTGSDPFVDDFGIFLLGDMHTSRVSDMDADALVGFLERYHHD